MKAFFLFLVLFSFSCTAQSDTEHWFAPVFDGQQNDKVYYILYLSTAETIPFKVFVNKESTSIYAVDLSSDQPMVLYLEKADISTKDRNEVLKVISKGIHITGDKKFVAQLRILVTDSGEGFPVDAEIIASKGRQALGLDFMIGNIPNTIDESGINFQASIIATEDDTKVRFKNVNAGLQFSANSDILKEEIVLNRGESFILSGAVQDKTANLQGLLGAEISASKPIALTNGHFNGQYFYKLYQRQADILLDQAIPIEKTGKEYIVVKGISPLESSMEVVLVIASENNTSIVINNELSQEQNLNKGEYLLLNRDYFDNDAMYLTGSKNFYVYQFFGAAKAPARAFSSGGMMLIPPLDCYFPRKVETIAYPNEIFGNEFSTNLNIITKKGAAIKINGAPLNPAIVANTIKGKDDWVYFVAPNINGIINSVSSTKGMFVQLIGGNRAVGYGAAYSGFQKDPEIKLASADGCIPGVELSVDAEFDYYQWQLNGVDIVSATAASYKPIIQGYYSCKVSNDGCPLLNLPAVYVFDCVNALALEFEICSILKLDLTQLHPNFNLATFEILDSPKNGRLNKNGNFLVYELTDLPKRSDVFKYKICAPDGTCYRVQVTLSISGSFTSETAIQYFLCKNEAATTLKLADSYDSYEWSTDETGSTIEAGLGEYYVDLANGDCVSRQYFRVDQVKIFTIKSIKITQDKVTIFTSDGATAYLYSLNGIDYQTSNEFYNLKSGTYTAYVKLADSDCEILAETFVIFNIPNFISPNADGINDEIDFSPFRNKKEVQLQIFNRLGKIVYQTERDLIWTGKLNNKNLATGTYWYVLSFKEDLTDEPIVYKGWILLKTN